MIEYGIVLGHIVSSKGIEVDKAKINLISSLPYPTSMRKVLFFLGHVGFYHSIGVLFFIIGLFGTCRFLS